MKLLTTQIGLIIACLLLLSAEAKGWSCGHPKSTFGKLEYAMGYDALFIGEVLSQTTELKQVHPQRTKELHTITFKVITDFHNLIAPEYIQVTSGDTLYKTIGEKHFVRAERRKDGTLFAETYIPGKIFSCPPRYNDAQLQAFLMKWQYKYRVIIIPLIIAYFAFVTGTIGMAILRIIFTDIKDLHRNIFKKTD